MNRIFRIKYMRFMAVLMAAAVFAGSIDTSLFYVQAAQGYETDEGENGEAVLASELDDFADGIAAADGGRDGETLPGDTDGQGGEVQADVIDGAVQGSGTDNEGVQGEPSYEDDAAAMADEAGTTQVTISGIEISDKVYDGQPITYNAGRVRIVKEADGQGVTDVTDTLKGELQYRFSGTKANGDAYPSGGGATADAPTDAGQYKLVATISNGEYEGSWEQSFEIRKRPVTISGIKIFSRKYDREQITYDNSGVTIVKSSGVQAGEEADVTDILKGKLQYGFSGTKSNGEAYPKEGGTTAEGPVDAGKYILAVTFTDDNYEGGLEVPFQIEQRKVTIRPEDVRLTIGDEIPEEYLYEVTLTDEDNPFEEEGGFITDPTVTCSVESTATTGEYPIVASGADAGNNYEIIYEEGVLTVVEPDPPKAKLIRVISPSPVRNVAFGTKLADIVLPETVQIFKENLDAQEGDLKEISATAGVDWVRAPIEGTTYSPSLSAKQTFKLGGTVILPDDVELPEDADETALYVTIEVNVREEMVSTQEVATPTADIESPGHVKSGTLVNLSCETEGALIYYTLNGEDPSMVNNSIRYSGPIGIYGDTVIRAYAVKSGYPDSAVVKFSYYVDDTSGDNSGEGDEPEVPAEDIPSGGIPEGELWVTEVKEQFVYTGTAIKPTVRVYDYKTLLTENKDYTVSYKNNVNAADANAAKAPTITITGKGNYEGKLTRTFTIERRNINDTGVSVDDIAVAYNKKAQKPSPTVVWNGKKLTNKKDYTIPDVKYTEVGNYPITVTGNGNYVGERTFVFTITDAVPVSKLTVAKIPDQTYTGETIKPELTIKYKGQQLTVKEKSLLDPSVSDCTVKYENNREVGTATVTIEGDGVTYVGTRKVTFKVKEVASLSKAKFDVQFGDTTYTGQPITASSVNATISLKGENEPRSLNEYRDYMVTYQKNDKAGTATIIFTGMGAYRGTVKKTFKIAPYDVQNARVIVNVNASCPYVKGGCKPEPIVMFGGSILKLGTDYTLSYKKNNAVGSEATVNVKGKGNFKGSVTRPFTITTQDIGVVTVSAVDKVYQNKKNIYKTTVSLTDTDGKALKAGTDYDKNIEYTYAEDTNVKTAPDDEKGIIREKGAAVEADDIIPAGATINVKIYAREGSNYTKDTTVTGTYRIVGANISGAKVTVPTQTYTGKAIELSPSQITVVLKGQTLTSSDYEIVGYSNNINKGTAKVVLRGLGDYGGTKTVTFKIKGKGLFG